MALALVSSLFLILASVTGVILAVDAVQEKLPSYKVENFEAIKLSQMLPVVREKYPEITALTIDHNQFVTLEGIDKKGEDVSNYIDPRTGEIIGKPLKKSEFIQWITALHRSLFLKETGRFFVGLISFFLIIIALSGFVLVLKRQRGLRNFFSKVVKEYLAQYYHVVLGRLALIPILILALSGTYLSVEKFNFFVEKKAPDEVLNPEAFSRKKAVFEHTFLVDLQQIEFPFSDDPEDFYILKLKDREIEVEQFTGVVVGEKLFPTTQLLSNLSLDLHTGRTTIWWAIILGLASLNILYFIYSGFAMTLKRRAVRLKNKFKADESEIILLVGSENGSTLGFANAIYKQLLASGKKVFITQMNQYQLYPKATELIVFAATHGLGDAPFNATKFIGLVEKFSQKQKINFSVVGFGSKAYPDFCGYARQIDVLLSQQAWAVPKMAMQTVNDKAAEEFVNWVALWNQKNEIQLSTTLSLYNQLPKNLQKMMVLDKTTLSETDQTFLLTLRANNRTGFTSGDLLAIYPANDTRERLYSIGKNKGNIQLVVKLHPSGLGSEFLYNLKVGTVIKARMIENKAFHLPPKTKLVALISNGTGIAPFLGMIEQNKVENAIHLYAGFRKETENTRAYQSFGTEMIYKNKLHSCNFAFSREKNHFYVMDLIKRDSDFFADLLKQGGVLMICGSLAMQKDVEATLDVICQEKNYKSLAEYKLNGQVLTDCY